MAALNLKNLPTGPGDDFKIDVSYAKGICPVAESLHDSTYLGFEMCQHWLPDEEVDLMATAFEKVWAQLGALK